MFVFMNNIKIFGIIRQYHHPHQSLNNVLILECVCQHRPSYQWWGGDDYHRIPIPETVLRKQMFSKCHRRSPPTALPTILVNLISAPSNNRSSHVQQNSISNQSAVVWWINTTTVLWCISFVGLVETNLLQFLPKQCCRLNVEQLLALN